MIRMIAAHDNQQGIAKNGIQPWKLSLDEAYFYQNTMSYGGHVLMGSETFKAIGRPLEDRDNIILSHAMDPSDGIRVIHDLDTFLRDNVDNLWVIGGANIYAQLLPYTDELYITNILADFGCDKFFPDYEPRFSIQDTGDLQTENGFIFHYDIFVKS